MAKTENLEAGLASHLEEIQQAIAAFRDKFAISFIVSISGDAEKHNEAYAYDAISGLIEGLKDSSCAILTGGTKYGVPEIGTVLAKEKGIPTIGLFPANGEKYALFDVLDLAIKALPPSIGPAGFGSETPSFVQLPDYAVYIGGAYGTLAEVSTMLKVNSARHKKNLELISIIPISGSGGAAELIPSLVQLSPNLAYCLPQFQITTGEDAAQFIKDSETKK